MTLSGRRDPVGGLGLGPGVISCPVQRFLELGPPTAPAGGGHGRGHSPRAGFDPGGVAIPPLMAEAAVRGLGIAMLGTFAIDGYLREARTRLASAAARIAWAVQGHEGPMALYTARPSAGQTGVRSRSALIMFMAFSSRPR